MDSISVLGPSRSCKLLRDLFWDEKRVLSWCGQGPMATQTLKLIHRVSENEHLRPGHAALQPLGETRARAERAARPLQAPESPVRGEVSSQKERRQDRGEPEVPHSPEADAGSTPLRVAGPGSLPGNRA